MTPAMLHVRDPGPLALVEDLGRPGWAALGVAPSGAFDRPALALANRLVGNHPGAAGVEVTSGGLVVQATSDVTVAVCGAPCALRTTVPGPVSGARTGPAVSGARTGPAAFGAAIRLRAGAVLRLDAPIVGVRSYLAVRGGVDVPRVLGSRSRDVLAGLGTPPLRAGDLLAVGDEAAGPVPGLDPLPPSATVQAVDAVLGPREDWFTDVAAHRLLSTGWVVRGDADRVGVRLDGPPLQRARAGELPSEPTRPGAVQVPPDGRPIVLGPDAPTTGGYPVIAVAAVPSQLAQLRPGDTVRFRRRSA